MRPNFDDDTAFTFTHYSHLPLCFDVTTQNASMGRNVDTLEGLISIEYCDLCIEYCLYPRASLGQIKSNPERKGWRRRRKEVGPVWWG